MIIVMFSIVLVVLAVSTILIAVSTKHLSDEINEMQKRLEQHQIWLQDLDFNALSEHERRLNKLEEARMKEFFNEEHSKGGKK